MTLFTVIAQITYDSEEHPNLDGIADMLANWSDVRRVRVRPAGQPKAAPTLRSTANSRFKDIYTEQQFLDHEDALAAAEREVDVDMSHTEVGTGGVYTAPAPASGGQLPEDAKPSRAKRA